VTFNVTGGAIRKANMIFCWCFVVNTSLPPTVFDYYHLFANWKIGHVTHSRWSA